MRLYFDDNSHQHYFPSLDLFSLRLQAQVAAAAAAAAGSQSPYVTDPMTTPRPFHPAPVLFTVPSAATASAAAAAAAAAASSGSRSGSVTAATAVDFDGDVPRVVPLATKEGSSRGNSLEMCFLGTSSSSPSERRNVSSVALKVDSAGTTWLFDCGDGTLQRLLMAPNIGVQDITKIFISHHHSDHVLGLPQVRALSLNKTRVFALFIMSTLLICICNTISYLV